MPHWPEVVEYLNGLDVVEPTIKGLVMRPQPPQLTIVVLPAKNSPVYPTVKRVAEIETGLMTQCITIQNVQNAKDTVKESNFFGNFFIYLIPFKVMENLLLKINMKIGGRNNKLGPDERIFRSIMEKGGGTLVLVRNSCAIRDGSRS